MAAEPQPAAEPEPIELKLAPAEDCDGDTSAAAAGVDEPKPIESEHPPIIATYSVEGKLGLVFKRSDPPPLRIADITPDGLASRDGKLCVGMRLQSVQSPALGPDPVMVTTLPYAEIIDVMKRAGRPITLTFRIPAPAQQRSAQSRKIQLGQVQATAQRVHATAQRTLGAASVMLRDVQRQYTVEQQRRRGSVNGTIMDNAVEQEVQYEVALPNDGEGIGIIVANSEDGPFIADFNAQPGNKPSRAELAGVRLGSHILAVNGNAVAQGGRKAVVDAVRAAVPGEPLLFLLVAPASSTAMKLAEGVVAVQERSAKLAHSLQKQRQKYTPLVNELRATAEKRLQEIRYKGLRRYQVLHEAVVRDACATNSRKVGVLRVGEVVVALKEEQLVLSKDGASKDNEDSSATAAPGESEEEENSGKTSHLDEAIIERVQIQVVRTAGRSRKVDNESAAQVDVDRGWVSKAAIDGTLLLLQMESDEDEENEEGQGEEKDERQAQEEQEVSVASS